MSTNTTCLAQDPRMNQFKITYFHRISTYNIERCHWSAQYRIYLFLHTSIIVLRWSTSNVTGSAWWFWTHTFRFIEKKNNKQIKQFMYEEGISASAIVVAHFAFSPDYKEEWERKEHIHSSATIYHHLTTTTRILNILLKQTYLQTYRTHTIP